MRYFPERGEDRGYGGGKALRFGKGKDGSISCLTYRLKSSVNPEKLPEDELPFPMRFGRLEFRFRPVDWSLGDPPFNMMLKLEGPLRTNLHLTYTRPHSDGNRIASGCLWTISESRRRERGTACHFSSCETRRQQKMAYGGIRMAT